MLPTTAAAAAKPTLLILSATGAQGSSVIEHLLKSQSLAINNGNSILRGTTRNPDSEVSKALVAKGVEMVKADFGDKASLLAAFQGVDIVFANTNFWDKEIVAGDQTLEVKQGKLVADVAAETKVKFLIYSALPSSVTISKGKFDKVLHFDGKAEILAYMQSKVPTISVEPGFYMTNFKYFAPPQTNADGAMVWAFPCTPETLVPAIDIPSDYGAAVTKVCESPEKFVGKRFFIAGEYISLKKFGEDIAAALGKKAVVVQAPRETYVAGLSAHMGPVVAEELTQMYEYFQYFGYYGGEPLSMAELGLKGTSVESWAKTGAAAKLFA